MGRQARTGVMGAHRTERVAAALSPELFHGLSGSPAQPITGEPTRVTVVYPFAQISFTRSM